MCVEHHAPLPGMPPLRPVFLMELRARMEGNYMGTADERADRLPTARRLPLPSTSQPPGLGNICLQTFSYQPLHMFL